MFRRKGDTISPDASYPANLKELGFFINKLGHIRMIEAPDKPFVFNATNIERHNEVRNEALHACSRAEVIERASKLGIKQLFFPQLTTVKPAGPHIPILAPSADILRTRKRIVVIINDTLQDLGILACRQLQRDLGLNGGSVINFAKEMVKRSARNDKESPVQSIFDDGVSIEDNETPGLIVLNAGQLLYSHKFNRCMTLRSWYALPRKSIAHDAIRIHEEDNYVEGHRTPAQHIKSVFDQLLCNPEYVSPDADLYIVAIEDGAKNALEVINDDFDKYGTRIAAMAMIHTLAEISDLTHPSLKALLHQRTRQWKYSDLGLDPEECTELPDGYSCGAPKQTLQQDTNVIRWNAELPRSSLSEIATTLHRLTLDSVSSSSDKSAPTKSDPDASYDWGSGSVPCPTFAGGQEPAGECVFTDPAVQRAILSFFEDVAQDPENYRNPAFTTVIVPSPTADEPFTLDANAPVPETVDISAAHLMTPEQLELDEARKKLADMRIALGACPDDVDVLAKGRKKLAAKVAKQEAAIQDLQVKALGSGALGAEEAEDLRQEWKPQVDGPRVPFAGTMVDSELLKAAGLGETASEELEKLGEGKAFL